jgi:carboxymethylenebutenolidase
MNDARAHDAATGLVPQPLGRRGLMMTTLIAGFTLGTTRVEAQAIHTDTTSIDAGEVKVPAGDVDLPGYFAKPQGAGPFPIVIVNEEVFGVHEYLKDVCRRLAKAGYAAICVEIYARVGDLTKTTNYGPIVSAAPDTTAMSDLDSALRYAAAHGGDAGRAAVTGFCRGGRYTWLYAAHSRNLKAAVAWYGPLGGNRTDIQPKTAMDVAAEINCPLLSLSGAKDPIVKPEDVEAAIAKARAAGKTAEMVIYPDTGHGFHADYRPSYNAADAEDGWKRMLAWFKSHGA